MLRPSVIECATVNVLTCHSTVRSRPLRRKRPSTNSTWSNPYGTMCVKPSARYLHAVLRPPGRAGGAVMGNGALVWPPSSHCVLTAVPALRTVNAYDANVHAYVHVNRGAPGGTPPLRRMVARGGESASAGRAMA